MSILDKVAATFTPAASDQERDEARQSAQRLAVSEPWLAAILEQHKQIESLLAEAINASNPASRFEALRQLAAAVTAHATAEEAVIYPDLSQFSGMKHAATAYEEHAMTKIQLAELEKVDPASSEWREKLNHVHSALKQHMFQEERDWMPDLARAMPAEEKHRIAERYHEEYVRYAGSGSVSAGALFDAQPPRDDGEQVSDAVFETQAMPHDGRKGSPDGVNTQGQWRATGGSDAGAPYPNPHTGKAESEREDFANDLMGHGGQSKMGYHGSGQLGDEAVEPGGNENSGARQG